MPQGSTAREPEEARLDPPVGGRDHARGPADAPVTLVEYGDFECVWCGRAYPVVKKLQERLGDRMRFVFRYFPLRNVHPHAEAAAEAAEAAANQGRFWEMHDALFANQRALGPEELRRRAAEVGLDRERFEREMAEHAHAARVREDFASARRSGLDGTPTFFINGVRHEGPYRFGDFLAAIERAAEEQAKRGRTDGGTAVRRGGCGG